MIKLTTTIIAGAMIMSAAAAPAAQAKSFSEDTAVVEYRMSELSTATGVKRIQSRVDIESLRACEASKVANYHFSASQHARCARRLSKELMRVIEKTYEDNSSDVLISENGVKVDKLVRLAVKHG